MPTSASELHPYLRERGFQTATVSKLGWRIEPVGTRAGKYGLPPEARGASAWFFPYRHENGRVAFERLRLIEEADLERFGGGKYRQPAGRSLSFYDPLGVLRVDGPMEWVFVTEGEAN